MSMKKAKEHKIFSPLKANHYKKKVWGRRKANHNKKFNQRKMNWLKLNKRSQIRNHSQGSRVKALIRLPKTI